MKVAGHRHFLWWAYGAFCFVSTLCRAGYDPLSVNAPVQLALVAWLRNPSLYTSDPIHETYPYYTFSVWRLIALVPQSVPLDKMLFVLWVGTRILLLYAVFRFAKSMAPDNPVAWMSAMAVVGAVPIPQIGSGTLLSTHFEQTSAAIPFILLCASAFWEKRYLLCGFWLGVVADLNPLYAFYVAVYLIMWGVFAVDWRADRRHGWKIAVTAVPTAFPSLVLFLSRPPIQVDDLDFLYWVDRIRSPLHLFPLAFERWRWVAYAGSLLLTALVIRTGVPEHKAWRQAGWTWMLTSLLFTGVAFLAAYGVKSYWLLTLSSARASDVWVCLTSVLLVCVTSEQVRRAFLESRGLYAHVGLWSVTLVWWGLVRRSQAVLGAILVCLLLAWLWKTLLRVSIIRRVHLPVYKGSLALPVVLIVVALIFINRHYIRRLPNIRMFDRSEIYAIASWCRTHTPQDAVFLIPPVQEEGWGGFRFLAQRGIFVSWKDGTNILFAPFFARIWAERLAMLEPRLYSIQPPVFQPAPLSERVLSQRYTALREEQVRQIAQRFKVDYWIAPANASTTLPEVYRDGRWKILTLSPVKDLARSVSQ